MAHVTLISKDEYLNGTSDYVKSLRARFGQNGYDKYVAKMNSIMTNPLDESKKAYIQAKKEEYIQALANAKKANTVWGEYKNNYQTNLAAMRANNNGFSLTSDQKKQALQASGSGAAQALINFNNANSEVDYALSLYNDATHSGMSFMG